MAPTQGGWPRNFPKAEYSIPDLVTSADGTAIQALHYKEDAFTRLSKATPKGEVVPLVPPLEWRSRVAGFARTTEGTFVSQPGDARIVLGDDTGALRAELAGPEWGHVVCLIGHPKRSEVAFIRDESGGNVPTTARVYRLTADDLLAGRGPTLLAERPFRPAIAFDPAGNLVVVDSGCIRTFEDGSEQCTEVAIEGRYGGPAEPVRLSISGSRMAMVENPIGGNLLVVDRKGQVVRLFEGLLSERAQLVEQGHTLVMTAEAAKARTGSAEDVEWLDPRMSGNYVALVDVDSGKLRGLAPRSGGTTQALAVVEGEVLAVASWGRSKKIELIPWSAMAG